MKFSYFRFPQEEYSPLFGPAIVRPVIEVKLSQGEYFIDYAALIDSGADFSIFGAENSDLEQEINFAKTFIQKIGIEKRIPEIDDIKKLLEDGYLVICNVNSYMLNNKERYTGHFVVVKGFSDTDLILHDPGLPPQENRVVDFATFEKAWAYPDEVAKNIMAFKKSP